jgi:hypothetical protein
MSRADRDDAAGPPSERSRVRRYAARGEYDRRSLDAVLDAGLLCFVAYLSEGAPRLTPTLYWRDDEFFYWHGSSASTAIESAEGAEVCVAVAHLDGLVFAKSAFHHSVNYRSAVLYGRAERILDPQEKERALKAFMDSAFPGRWAELRPVTAQELKATGVLRLRIDEFSVKRRDGPPVEGVADHDWPAWSGVVPLYLSAGAPAPASGAEEHVSPEVRRPAARAER